MDDVGADVEGLDAVEVVEIVFQVEFVHPQGSVERGEIGGLL